MRWPADLLRNSKPLLLPARTEVTYRHCRNRSHERPGRYNAGYVWVISSVAALGGLLFGYDWVVIGGAKPFYENYLSP